MGGVRIGGGPLRVVSLLPSATENFFTLLNYVKTKYTGNGSSNDTTSTSKTSKLPLLVGRSHECDFPKTKELSDLPVLTTQKTVFTNSKDVHVQVQQALTNTNSLYTLCNTKLKELEPDVILMQKDCQVCSIDLTSVEQAVKNSTIQIVTFDGKSLQQVLVDDFLLLGEAIGLKEEAKELTNLHLKQLEKLNQVNKKKQPKVLLIEWLDPLFLVKKNSTSWMKEMIDIAGGQLVDNKSTFKEADFVIFALCGLDIEQTKKELNNVLQLQPQHELTQLFNNNNAPKKNVYLVNGMSMFSRPTPRLLTAIEWLIQIFYSTTTSTVNTEMDAFSTSIAIKYAVTVPPPTAPLSKPEAAPTCMLNDIEELHLVACQNKESMYKDPKTGYSVLTSFYLQERGTCCGNGCRHCPYGHVNVKDPTRRQNQLQKPMLIHPKPIKVGSNKMKKTTTTIIRQPSRFWFDTESGTTFSTGSTDGTGDLNIMFWSGGKDSFLALSEFVKTICSPVNSSLVLLTTIDPESRTVPIQNIPMQTILQQAKHMDLPVCVVPVPQGSSNQVYTDHVFEALDTIIDQIAHSKTSVNLIFGDLHVQDIRTWREQVFDSYKQKLHLYFPLWQKDVKSELLPLLEQVCQDKKASILFTTDVPALGMKQGDIYDLRQILKRPLPPTADHHNSKKIDPMGENGEFHTCIHF